MVPAGVKELVVDPGEGDDTFIGAQPENPIGKTLIVAQGGEGDDSFIGGPGGELFVSEYEYPTPHKILLE